MDPIGRKLNPEERDVLSLLTQDDRRDDDRTAVGIGTELDRDPTDVAGVLSRLKRDGLTDCSTADPGFDDVWVATDAAAAALESSE